MLRHHSLSLSVPCCLSGKQIESAVSRQLPQLPRLPQLPQRSLPQPSLPQPSLAQPSLAQPPQLTVTKAVQKRRRRKRGPRCGKWRERNRSNSPVSRRGAKSRSRSRSHSRHSPAFAAANSIVSTIASRVCPRTYKKQLFAPLYLSGF